MMDKQNRENYLSVTPLTFYSRGDWERMDRRFTSFGDFLVALRKRINAANSVEYERVWSENQVVVDDIARIMNNWKTESNKTNKLKRLYNQRSRLLDQMALQTQKDYAGYQFEENEFFFTQSVAAFEAEIESDEEKAYQRVALEALQPQMKQRNGYLRSIPTYGDMDEIAYLDSIIMAHMALVKDERFIDIYKSIYALGPQERAQLIAALRLIVDRDKQLADLTTLSNEEVAAALPTGVGMSHSQRNRIDGRLEELYRMLVSAETDDAIDIKLRIDILTEYMKQ